MFGVLDHRQLYFAAKWRRVCHVVDGSARAARSLASVLIACRDPRAVADHQGDVAVPHRKVAGQQRGGNGDYYQPRLRHSSRWGRSTPRVVSSPWPG